MVQKQLPDDEWRRRLTPEQYAILRKKHTEAPFTGALLHNAEHGVYTCAACGAVLFRSEHKFDSGSGWPSFYDLARAGAVRLEEDRSQLAIRTEVLCAQCGGHLGHLFHDAPHQPTGDRYCINSGALTFLKQ